MSYREKIAWLSLIAMAATFGPYFVMVAMSPPSDALPLWTQLALYAKTALSQVVILGLGHLYLRRRWPEDARQPLDERDRTINTHSMKTAYFILITGMILVGVVMPFYEHGWRIINAALFMIVLAEMVRYSVIVFCYRRQSS